MEKSKQPKDFVPQDFEDFLKDEYSYLTFPQKIIYQLQQHVYLVVVSSSIIGYYAGTTFGKFW